MKDVSLGNSNHKANNFRYPNPPEIRIVRPIHTGAVVGAARMKERQGFRCIEFFKQVKRYLNKHDQYGVRIMKYSDSHFIKGYHFSSFDASL